MSSPEFNKYRAAIEVLQRGRDSLMDELAETVLDQADDLLEGGFLFHEFLENQGTRLHFLCLLLSQLEQSAEVLDEAQAIEAINQPEPEIEVEIEEIEPPPARKRRSKPRSTSSASSSSSTTPSRPRGGKKLQQRQSSREGSPDDA